MSPEVLEEAAGCFTYSNKSRISFGIECPKESTASRLQERRRGWLQGISSQAWRKLRRFLGMVEMPAESKQTRRKFIELLEAWEFPDTNSTPEPFEWTTMHVCVPVCFSCHHGCSRTGARGAVSLRDIEGWEAETTEHEQRQDIDYRAICTIRKVGRINTRCLATIHGTALPVELPTAVLQACNVLKDGQFEWRMRENGEVRAEDISSVSETPSLSSEEEAELERLYEKYRSEKA